MFPDVWFRLLWGIDANQMRPHQLIFFHKERLKISSSLCTNPASLLAMQNHLTVRNVLQLLSSPRLALSVINTGCVTGY